MILDRLERASMYRGLGRGIAAALDYLRQTDFSQMPDGRYELEGNRLIVILQHYRPKAMEAAMWEAHRKFIDVQYVAQGAERIGYAALHDGLPVSRPYDDEKDVEFYDIEGDFFDIRGGGFVIFAPHDIHAPGLAVTRPPAFEAVHKVVVKCRIPE